VRLASAGILTIAAAASLLALTPARGDDENQDLVNPFEGRRAWMGLPTNPLIAAARYTLTKQELANFKGTFGVDLSHYSFDTKNNGSISKCSTPDGYNDPECSCAIDWKALSDNGLVYVYSKASDATWPDLSFPRSWSQLEPRHASKTLFRGAYHFLRPNVDGNKQADAFLNAIGATDGRKPAQLPPVVDMEWSNKKIVQGTPEYNACPATRRQYDKDNKRWLCDMWYQMSAAEIAATARTYTERVQKATGRPVIIYTNPGWWNQVMARAGDPMLKQAIWTSRYTAKGPKYDSDWNDESGGLKWGMAPLPKGDSYPQDKYSVANFWQFTDNGVLPSKVLTCRGTAELRGEDMNWLPVDRGDFATLFGVDAP
jgi:GH25 family lysozyme M1 (1,4-beta-N-acetylmuramidase)